MILANKVELDLRLYALKTRAQKKGLAEFHTNGGFQIET